MFKPLSLSLSHYTLVYFRGHEEIEVKFQDILKAWGTSFVIKDTYDIINKGLKDNWMVKMKLLLLPAPRAWMDKHANQTPRVFPKLLHLMTRQRQLRRGPHKSSSQ